MDETHGFMVPPGAPVLLTVDIPDVAREQMVRILAAVVTGGSPEEIAGYLSDGWPPVVVETLDRLGEQEELSAHVDLLVAALRAEL